MTAAALSPNKAMTTEPAEAAALSPNEASGPFLGDDPVFSPNGAMTTGALSPIEANGSGITPNGLISLNRREARVDC
jgi:hypothetical protein